jgi:hypothetical protein
MRSFSQISIQANIGYRDRESTHVINAATSVWKKRAAAATALDRKAPIRVQRAKTPRKKEHTEKNRAIRMKANMKRVR